MASSKKAQVLAETMAMELRLRGRAAVVSFDATTGEPQVAVGTLTAAGDGALLVVSQISGVPAPQNILGQAAELFTPHLVKAAWEDDTNVTAALRALVTSVATSTGCNVEVYQTAATVVPTASAPGTLVVSIPASAQYPLAGQ